MCQRIRAWKGSPSKGRLKYTDEDRGKKGKNECWDTWEDRVHAARMTTHQDVHEGKAAMQEGASTERKSAGARCEVDRWTCQAEAESAEIRHQTGR